LAPRFATLPAYCARAARCERRGAARAEARLEEGHGTRSVGGASEGGKRRRAGPWTPNAKPGGSFRRAFAFTAASSGAPRCSFPPRTSPHAFTVVGGGDTVGYVESRKLTEHFGHVSTGGGASLELMGGGKLPGIEALMDKK